MATVLEQVHAALRIKSRTLDDAEITPLIEACKADLRMHGVRRVDETDPLIARAIVLYCKAYFGYDDQTERWQACYDGLRDSMELSGDYREEDI